MYEADLSVSVVSFMYSKLNGIDAINEITKLII